MKIDGIDVRDATLNSLRDQISIVTQDSVIFPAPSPRISRTAIPAARPAQEIRSAAAANARSRMISSWKNRRAMTRCSADWAAQLSGGQKQRLNIARAILRASADPDSR